jgi:RNA recognition motif-containing protein
MRLYVGNLPYQLTEGELESWFAEAGVAVDNVDLIRDKFSGEARGFGFVEIQDDSSADVAIQACNGKDLMGRRVVVNEARPKSAMGGGMDEGGGHERRRPSGGPPGGKRGGGGGSGGRQGRERGGQRW